MKRKQRENKKYGANGITVTPAILAKGDTAKVTYSGLLADDGADRMYVRFGFGDWERAVDYRMIPADEGFEAHVPISEGEDLQLCFKDSADHWDNNSGRNYSFEVSGRR